MRIGRTLPPAAAPVALGDLLSGLRGMLAGARELEQLRSELRRQFGVKHCFLVSSGKAAFTLILQALQALAPERDEVLVPAFTCYSVPSSIVRAGLRVRLCDLQPEGLDFDFPQLSALLGQGAERVLAVVPTHLFGLNADVARVRRLARNAGTAVVEDAAQAMGEEGASGKLGTGGDAGFFSLGRGKAMSVVEGGVILTDRDDLARVLYPLVDRLPGYGPLGMLKLLAQALALILLVRPALFWLPRALPFLRLGETLYDPRFPMRSMSAFQAGLARNWRRKLASMREDRAARVCRYAATLEVVEQCAREALAGRRAALLRFPVRLRDPAARARVLRESERRGLGVMPSYPDSIAAIPALQGMLERKAFPAAARCAKELVTLPTHGYVTPADVAAIGDLIVRAVGDGVAATPEQRATLGEQA